MDHMNKTQLSKAFGVTRERIDDWVRDGCPIVRMARNKGGEYQFDPIAVKRWAVGTGRMKEPEFDKGCAVGIRLMAKYMPQAVARSAAGVTRDPEHTEQIAKESGLMAAFLGDELLQMLGMPEGDYELPVEPDWDEVAKSVGRPGWRPKAPWLKKPKSMNGHASSSEK